MSMVQQLRHLFSPRALISCATLVLLGACGPSDLPGLPEYWLCSGSSNQTIQESSGKELERYEGKDPVMLEIWGDRIYQFLQGNFSGRYAICYSEEVLDSSNESIQFQLHSCSNQSHSENIPERQGVLNKATGELLMVESFTRNNQLIKNQGRYQCRKKGKSFNFSEFNHV